MHLAHPQPLWAHDHTTRDYVSKSTKFEPYDENRGLLFFGLVTTIRKRKEGTLLTRASNTALVISLLAYLAVESAARGAPTPWPQDGSDLKPDPAITFGALDNGMRYEIQRNTYPAGRVSFRFRVDVGSRVERLDERGIAHFLEHMAFRGSTHFPDGTIVKRMASLGLRTGADANAGTSETQTVFRLDLPNPSPEAAQAALSFFRGIADGLTLDPQAVESERKVVLSEARLSDTPIRRMALRSTNFTLASLNKELRPAIGDADNINAITPEQLAVFYRAFYRPERVTMIVVGDVDPPELAAKLNTQFGDWRGVQSERVPQADGEPQVAQPVHVDTEPRVGNFIQVTWTSPDDGAKDSVGRRRTDLVTTVALDVLDRRYDIVEQRPHPPFYASAADQSRQPEIGSITGITVSFEEGEWRSALKHMEAIRRGTLKGPIRQQEVDAIAARILARYRTSAETTENHVTPRIADVLLSDLDQQRVSVSSVDEYALARGELQGLKVATVAKALQASFVGAGPRVYLRTVAPVERGDAALASAVALSRSGGTESVIVPVATKWPYTKFGTAGRVSSRTHIDDLDVTAVVYANGVHLNVKRTQFAPDQVEVIVSIGQGVRDLPLHGPPLDWAINNVFIGAGLKDLDFDSMRALLANKRFGAGFLANDLAFALAGSTRARDLDVQLQLLAAYCVAPALRAGVFEQSRNGYMNIIQGWQGDPYRLLQFDLQGLLKSGDFRYTQPTLDGMRNVRVQNLRDFLLPELRDAYMEVTVVGDVDVDEAITSLGKTFGALNPRQPAAESPNADGPFPPATQSPIVRAHQGGDNQGAAAIAWPSADMLSDGKRFYALSMLSSVMNTRLSERLRASLGTSYSGQVAYWSPEVGPESAGALVATADISPANESVFFEEVAKISADLRTNLISPEELDRARAPRSANLKSSMALNGFWMHWLDLSQRDPRRLEFARNAMTYLNSVGAKDVQAMAQEYLKDDVAWKVVYHKAQSRY
jgi:zinc protease